MRKIAVFTGTRAEYGLLYWIIRKLHESDAAELQLLVGGMHLSHEFGYTVSQIEKDGFPIADRFEFLLSSDTPVGIAKSIALCLMSASECFARLKPDLVVLLGDRFESMAVAQAAMVSCIPIAHIHGGESTEGLIDEAVRHSITKMAHFHYTTTEAYRSRVIQLGESPVNVYNHGAPGIDSIKNLVLLERAALSKELDFNLSKSYFLVTYHPVTLSETGAAYALNTLLEALDEYKNYQVLITYPNADTHGRGLLQMLRTYCEKHPGRVMLTQSLGQIRYLSALKYAEAVLGNSSSGLIEAPAFGIPTINIGDRQKGRVAGETVIHCKEDRNSVSRAIDMALSDDFRRKCKKSVSPYGEGGASEEIFQSLLRVSLKNVLVKKFNDLKLPQ